jgi:hypothetical protein
VGERRCSLPSVQHPQRGAHPRPGRAHPEKITLDTGEVRLGERRGGWLTPRDMATIPLTASGWRSFANPAPGVSANHQHGDG